MKNIHWLEYDLHICIPQFSFLSESGFGFDNSFFPISARLDFSIVHDNELMVRGMLQLFVATVVIVSNKRPNAEKK